MTEPDLKFDHAGAPLPPPLPVAETSSVSPLGSAGLVNQGRQSTVELVGPVYSDVATAAQAAAEAKRESDWQTLMSGNTPAGDTSSGY